MGIAALYSSDFVRARQTAEIIGDALGVAPEYSVDLRERSLGDLTGLTFDQARARYPRDCEALLSMQPDVRPPEGESYRDCAERAVRCLERVRSRHRGQHVVLVSHELTISLLILELLGIPLPTGPWPLHVRVDRCTLHLFECYPDGSRRVLALNDGAHLQGDATI
jgi:broad specificity phosphatase PhoE